jgi:hypothetical protein
VSTGGKGGYCQALYPVELTGRETKAELDAMAVKLLEEGAEPVWGGGKHCYHGGSYIAQPECTVKASARKLGSYLYVCYAFRCDGGEYNHVLTPYYERISTMGIRITEQSLPMELSFVLTDSRGTVLASLEDGGAAELRLEQGALNLSLESAVAHPNEEIVAIRAEFPEAQVKDAFLLDAETGLLTPVCCGSGSVTVTLRTYLTGQTREESITLTVPCAPQAEPTVITPNTCTEDGLAVYLCQGHGTNCETTFDQVILPATGHELFSVNQYVRKPTATQPGIGMGTCKKCGLIGVEQEVPPIFSDVAGDAFYSVPLDYCYARGWVTGATADTFLPNSNCVRAQVVTFLWRAAGCPAPASMENPFTDVQVGSFYEMPVLWAVENGITNGTSATTFGPNDPCNRASVVTFLWRAAGKPAPESTTHSFTDVAPGSFYESAVLWAVENGITNGVSATQFGPTASCNRAQVVTFLYRAFA